MFDGCCTNTNTNNNHRHMKIVRVNNAKTKNEKKNLNRKAWDTHMKFRGVAAFPKGDGWVLRVSILACAKSIKSVQKKKIERQRQRNKPNIVSAAVESLWLLENPRPFPAPFYTASAFFLCGSLPCSLLCVRVILFSEKRTLREKINYERKIHIKMLKITDRTTSTPRWRPPPTAPSNAPLDVSILSL